jgi:hypothetical protein
MSVPLPAHYADFEAGKTVRFPPKNRLVASAASLFFYIAY